MGRTKGSVNKSKVKKEKLISKEIIDEKAQVKSVKTEVHVPILEAPLMVFVCRRCQGNFYSNDEYTTHHCPAQIYAVVSEEPEEAPKAQKSPRKKKSKVDDDDEGKSDDGDKSVGDNGLKL